MKIVIHNREGEEFKIIGLGRKVKRVKSIIDWDAARRRIEELTKDKFEEYRRVRMLALATAQNIWWD